MKELFSSEKIWLIVYVAIAGSYIYMMETVARLPYSIMKYIIFASLCLVFIEYYMSKAFINNILNIFLFVSVLSTITLIKQVLYKFAFGELAFLLYIGTVFLTGTLWVISFSVILESNKPKYTIINKSIIMITSINFLLFVLLHYELYVYGGIELYETLIFIIPPGVIALLILLFDAFLFKYILRVLSVEQRKMRSLLYIDLFIHILYSFVILIPLIITALLLVTVKPGEKTFIALSILSSYIITAFILSIIAKIYINHGIVIDNIKTPREPYIAESIAHFYRMRYISALILLFNHIEASGRSGLEIMNTKASTIVHKGAENISRFLKRLLLYNKVLKLANELDKIRVVMVKLPRLQNDVLGNKEIVNSIKSIESNLLKAYQLILENKHPGNYIKTVRGNVKKIVSILWKQGNKDYKTFEQILSILNEISRNPEKINDLVEIRPLLVRDIRNYMVHGRLTREYFYYNNKIIKKLDLLENYDNLFLLYTTILSYIQYNYNSKDVIRRTGLRARS